jgi:VIT1/CCC1 family predicted Fe2+/Mn2+ transporter/rubrerythrin
MKNVQIKDWLAHWQDEGESTYRYRALAALERNEARKNLFLRLADVEARHQQVYEKLLRAQGVEPGPFRPRWLIRVQGWMARHGAAKSVVELGIKDELHEVKQYLKTRKPHAAATNTDQTAEQIAQDEAGHAALLKQLAGPRGEPWHRPGSGEVLRNIIYGFNDGLTANFGLVMGVIGAEKPEFVLISGIAGLAADALSMGGSGYLAAKSEQEVYQHELQLEQGEIELMPEMEIEELILLYEANGMPPETARIAASHVIKDPQVALQEMARQELGISEESSSPLRSAVTTGVATAIGALIPILPFLFGSGLIAIWTSFGISMLSHFAVGAARSLFTGRSIFRSGLDMFLVGLGVAAVGYFVGLLITGRL